MALARARGTTSLFYVDTLEYLRRGGRIGAAAALLGSALAVKPLLEIVDGRIATREKVRTTARALSRLEELAVAAAGEDPVDVAVAHLANPERAEALAGSLRRRLAVNLADRELSVGEVGAVIGAHVGPGHGRGRGLAPLTPADPALVSSAAGPGTVPRLVVAAAVHRPTTAGSASTAPLPRFGACVHAGPPRNTSPRWHGGGWSC